jgi:hypothetical protein
MRKGLFSKISLGLKVGQKVVERLSEKLEQVKDLISHDFFDYVEYYGDYTFEEKEFNEVDNVILSMLAYVDYTGIVSEGHKEKKTLNEVANEYFSKYTQEDIKNHISGMKTAITLLKRVSNTKRYKDILMFNYLYNGTAESQFSAITFDLGKRVYYVAFEGTDTLVSAWEEDCKMSYMFPVEAHKKAKKYLRKYTFKNVKLIVGGHSKGGNLALVGSMYTNFLVRWKIKKVYSNDGQGLRDKQINSRRYRKIVKKYIHIIPDSSIIGLFLRNNGNYIVVKSNMPGVLSHDAKTWQIDFNSFTRAKLSRFSRVFDEGFSKWLDSYTDKERELFTESVFAVLKDNNIETLMQFKDNYRLIIDVLKRSKDIDPVVKDMVKDLVRVINKTNLEYPLFK